MTPKKKTASEKILRIHTIEEDTPIIPGAVAESVLAEASRLLDIDLSPDLTEWLSGYATAVYANNPKFRKAINSEANHGNAGRDTLYAYMRHWLSSEILNRHPGGVDYSRIRDRLMNTGFSMGHEVR